MLPSPALPEARELELSYALVGGGKAMDQGRESNQPGDICGSLSWYYNHDELCGTG